MQRTPVSSSQIESVGYDPTSQTLEVEFKSRPGKHGSVYQYKGVSQSVYDEFISAPSIGVYFGANIKSGYEFQKVS